MNIFATPDDLTEWDPSLDLTVEGPDPKRCLRSASLLVTHAVRAARYDVDPSGKPREPDLSLAMQEATCAAAALWVRTGIDPGDPGLSKPTERVVQSRSLGGRGVTYATDDPAQAAARAQAAGKLCDEALLILEQAGLLDGQPGRY